MSETETNEGPKGIFFTTAQIDAAWLTMMRLLDGDNTAEHFIGAGMKKALNELGIVRCEGCGGGRSKTVMSRQTGMRAPCPDCAKFGSHGWVRIEEVEGE